MNAECGRAHAATGGYVHANAAFGDELGRLRLLEARYDPHTFRRLGIFGPLAGARCLEVGAGAGLVARWLAAQARPSGQVVATDSDLRFLADTDKAGVKVRRHDILADPPAPGRYDLVHRRALLYYRADLRQAVRNVAAAVRPGGWLLIQDADYVSLVAAEPAHPRAASFDQAVRRLLAFAAASGAFDPFLGRCLPLTHRRGWPGRSRIRSDCLPPAGRQRGGRVATPLTGTDAPDGPEQRHGRPKAA
jgi:SAM-dependent methyltransferase